MQGVYLPLVTAFRNGALDLVSHDRLVARYLDSGISGFVILGTTGESPTVTSGERQQVVERTVEAAAGKIPVYLGITGNDTRRVAAQVRDLQHLGVTGFLVASPYYSRPPQDGLAAHFGAVAESTDLAVVVYNIPYRTGVNLDNDTLLRLAATYPNIRAAKDCSGDAAQTRELIASAPEGFSVLTGEDHMFPDAVRAGAAGGILASAHLAPELYVQVHSLLREGQADAAYERWQRAARLVPALFAEPSPMPLKYCLRHLDLLDSHECRLPLTSVSASHAGVLDRLLADLDREP